MDTEWLRQQSNGSFINFIMHEPEWVPITRWYDGMGITFDENLEANLHRHALMREAIDDAAEYYGLKRKSALKAYERAVAQTWVDWRMGRIDLNQTTLHLHWYKCFRDHLWSIRYVMNRKTRESKLRQEQLRVFLEG